MAIENIEQAVDSGARFHTACDVMGIDSRAIVGWEVHENESSEHAARLISHACLIQGIKQEQLVLHSDNGSPMKGATMLATLQNGYCSILQSPERQ